MKRIRITRLAILAVMLDLSFPMSAISGSAPWQAGRVTAIEISGQGADAKAKSRFKRDDMWWTYGICTDAWTYFVVSRVSPVKLGLDIDSTVQFTVTASQLTMRDARGKQYVMRILRRTQSRDCSRR